MIRTGRVPEKPWRAEALIRLVASVIVCCLGGAAITMMAQFLGAPHGKATVEFVVFTIGTLGCFAGAVVMLMRPWPFEGFLRKLVILLLCLYGGFFLMWLAQRLAGQKNQVEGSSVGVLIAVLAFQGMALILVHFFLHEHHISWGEAFGFGNRTGLAILLGICAGLIALPLTLGLDRVSELILEWLGSRFPAFQPQPQETVVILQNAEGWGNRLAMGIATIAIAPMAEEILFRGILYPFIKRTGYPQLALWGTAFLFAAVHLNLVTFVPLAFLALVLIWIYEYSGNLLACIITHSLFNAANFIALYLSRN